MRKAERCRSSPNLLQCKAGVYGSTALCYVEFKKDEAPDNADLQQKFADAQQWQTRVLLWQTRVQDSTLL